MMARNRVAAIATTVTCVAALAAHLIEVNGQQPVSSDQSAPVPAQGSKTKNPVLKGLLSNLPSVGGGIQGSNDRLKEVDISVQDGKGMDERGVYQPAGYEIKEKLVYDHKKPMSNSIPQSGPVYPFGLGNVIMGGCFGSDYKPGDPCYSFKKANPFLCLDLLDGATFMGVGFDARETYSAESRRKGLLQRSCNEKRLFHDKDVPDNLVAQGIYEYDLHTMSYSSLESYQRELASKAGIALTSSSFSKEMKTVSAGAGGGIGPFSASVETSFSKGSEQSQSESSSRDTSQSQRNKQTSDLYVASLEADLLLFEIFQDSVKPGDLRWEFVNEFLSLPTSYYSPGAVIKFQDFILRWGTHYVKYAKFGGKLRLIKTKQSTRTESFSMFQERAEHEFQRTMATMSSASVQASFSSPWVSVKAGYSQEDSQGSSSGQKVSKEESDLSSSYREDAYGSTMFEIEGGDPDIASAIFDAFSPGFKSDFKAWLESIPEYAKPFDFKLGDISELVNFNVKSLLGKGCQGCITGGQETCNVAYGEEDKMYQCANLRKNETELNNRQLSLQRAIEVYMKEGPIPVYDIHIPRGDVDCEKDSFDSVGKTTVNPTWDELKTNTSSVRIVFDMLADIPRIIGANDVIQVKLMHGKWFVVTGRQLHLYNGYPDVNELNKLTVRQLIMTYDPSSGLFDVTPSDFNRSIAGITKLNPKINFNWLNGTTVARAQYLDPFAIASSRGLNDFIGSVPCNYRWSNVHRIDTFQEGRCIRFTASSSGDIFVMLAGIPSDTKSWYHIQISPKGVAIYKALKLQETVTEYGARGQGSDILYQTYFVCVLENNGTTRIWYGAAGAEEKNHQIWLQYVDASGSFGIKYYTFGAGESAVDVMDITVLPESFLEFACRGNLMDGGDSKTLRCFKDCHEECDPLYSCTRINDNTACGRCKNIILIRYADDKEVCVNECPRGYRLTQMVDSQPRCTHIANCPIGFKHLDGLKSCYKISDNTQTRELAATECQRQDSWLMDIQSDMEYNKLLNFIMHDWSPEVTEVRNLATTSLGVTCSASNSYSSDYDCYKAIDGTERHGSGREWVTQENTAIGAWIQFTFPEKALVTSVQLLARCYSGYQNKRIKLSFDDGTTQNAGLTCFSGGSISDCSGTHWQNIDVGNKLTKYIRIEITKTCTSSYNGFREIRIMGTSDGSRPVAAKRPVNLAVPSDGVSCSASSEYSTQYDCYKAMDGTELTGADREWVTEENTAVGSWILITFPERYTVTAIQLLQRCYINYQNKEIKLTFEDESTQNLRLTCFFGSDISDCDGQYWQSFPVPSKTTRSVRLEVTGVCTQRYNGFREIKIMGYKGHETIPTDNNHEIWTSGKRQGDTWTWESDGSSISRAMVTRIAETNKDKDDCLIFTLNGLSSEQCSERLLFACEKNDFDELY